MGDDMRRTMDTMIAKAGDVRPKEAREIKARRSEGYMATTSEQARVESTWLRLFGSPGCSHYPYMGFWDMVNDLIEGK